MTCAEASQLIGPWVDDELDVRAAMQIETHVARCPECGRERDELLTLRDTARDRLPRPDLSPQLEERLWKKVRAAAVPERPRVRRWAREASLMAAAACVAVVATVSVQRGGGLRDGHGR